MHNPLLIHKSTLDALFTFRWKGLGRYLMFELRDVARGLFFLSITLAVFCSLLPWFVWPVARFFQMIACVPLILSILLSRSLLNPIFTRTDHLAPLLSVTAVILCMALCSGKNLNGFLMIPFDVLIFYALFKINLSDLQVLGDVLAKTMGYILTVSIPIYILYLLGFSLPHYHVAPDAVLHTYDNYRFFLIDDYAEVVSLFPRFISIFPEPSWLGMGCVTLLYCQIGKWNTWRCRIMFVATIMSFSLAAIICLIVMLFSVAWMKGKAIIGKIFLLFFFIVSGAIGAIYYNDGDNIVNTLVVQRLALDEEGNLEGDDRTTDSFTKEFHKMWTNGEWLTGEGTAHFQRFAEGNSGYRVFLYINGMLSFILLVVFFSLVLRGSDNRRAILSFILFMALTFIAHGAPLRYTYIVPLYIFAYCRVFPHAKEKYIAHGSH